MSFFFFSISEPVFKIHKVSCHLCPAVSESKLGFLLGCVVGLVVIGGGEETGGAEVIESRALLLVSSVKSTPSMAKRKGMRVGIGSLYPSRDSIARG